MFATDFLFDGQRASDFGLIICSLDGGVETASGGEIEFNVVKTPNRDRFTFYDSQFNTVLEWNFTIMKNYCYDSNYYFNQYEESRIAKWLIKTDGYRQFQFDQEGYEDIIYNVYINVSPHQIGGKTIGFDLTVTSDCAYGFTNLITQKATINSSTFYKFMINSDINTYIMPIIKINGNGNFYISNDRDLSQNIDNEGESRFENIENEIIMDSDNDIISGLNSPNDFNWYFLRLVDGENIISTDSESDISLEIQYREPRRVIV